MNIFIPLLVGVLIGYLFRTRDMRVDLDVPMSAVLLLMIFFLGVKVGKVSVSTGWLLGSSIVFAVLTIIGSVGVALFLGVRR
ncbi:hypothetical protein [Thermococcus sp.]|uniref:hypothetical protein n=1 Tax=Thermococcus sp. TaxID=35749 RepID=UPI0026098D1E|nr:hypothetical protein [Thermococcus sp.]